MKNKIFLLGKDNSGWSIDADRQNVKKALIDLGFSLTRNPFIAEIFYVVWWNKMFKWSYRVLNIFFRRKTWIVTATNELDYQEEKVKKIDKRVDFWIFANQQQKKLLEKIGRKEESLFWNPFYVDENKFKKIKISRADLCKKIGIEKEQLKGRVLLGSFVKDSLGSDLTKPKWQKGTEMLRDVLDEIKKERILLVLAGPRRHFIIKECKKLKIPFIFIGNMDFIKKGLDDCNENNTSMEKINLLYNLVDICLVTSKSEGGPKAVIEAPLTKTAVISTRVGLAPDFLTKEMLCDNKKDFIRKIRLLLKDKLEVNRLAKLGYERVSNINNYDDFKKRVQISILKAGK